MFSSTAAMGRVVPGAVVVERPGAEPGVVVDAPDAVPSTTVVEGSGGGRRVRIDDEVRRIGDAGLAAEHRQNGLHVLRVEDGFEHRVAAHVAVPAFDLEHRDRRRIEVLHRVGDLQHDVGGEVGVGDDVLQRRVDQPIGDRRSRAPLSSAFCSVRFKKSCCRVIRPRSLVPSDTHSFVTGSKYWYFLDRT